MESEILNTLKEIRGMLFVIIACFGVLVFLRVVQVVVSVYLEIKSSLKKDYNTKANELFESQDYIGVVELSKKELEKNSRYSHAYWWLGRAHYNLGNDVESMKYFKELMEVEPTWEEEHIMPYLEKLRARAKSR